MSAHYRLPSGRIQHQLFYRKIYPTLQKCG